MGAAFLWGAAGKAAPMKPWAMRAGAAFIKGKAQCARHHGKCPGACVLAKESAVATS